MAEWSDIVVHDTIAFDEPNQLRVVAQAASGRICAISASNRDYLGDEGVVSKLEWLDDLALPAVLGVKAGAALRGLCGTQTGDRCIEVPVLLGPDRSPGIMSAARLGSPSHDGSQGAAAEELIIVAVTPADNDFVPRERPLGGINYVCDNHMSLLSIDGAMGRIGVRVDRLVGTNTALLCHPCDNVASIERFRELLRGEIDEVTATRRVIGPEGRWVRARVRARLLVGSVNAYVVYASFADDAEELPEVGLSRSELDVVKQVLGGWRVSQIAEARHSSSKTVRNQLSSAFAKLGVASQTELIERFGHHYST